MQVEGPGKNHEVPAVDDPLSLAWVVLADMNDRTPLECEVGVTKIGVTVPLAVVGHDPVGVPDECRAGHDVFLLPSGCMEPRLASHSCEAGAVPVGVSVGLGFNSGA